MMLQHYLYGIAWSGNARLSKLVIQRYRIRGATAAVAESPGDAPWSVTIQEMISTEQKIIFLTGLSHLRSGKNAPL
jgi:hypothetical protein